MLRALKVSLDYYQANFSPYQFRQARIVEFGRYAEQNRQKRGGGKPETFNFLGFTHTCGKTRKGGWFTVRRQTVKKRLRSKLQAVRLELRRRWHERTAETGAWLRSVVQGYFHYHAIPGNFVALQTFRGEVARAWLAALRRRSQRHRLPWERLRLDPGPLFASAADSASATWRAL